MIEPGYKSGNTDASVSGQFYKGYGGDGSEFRRRHVSTCSSLDIVFPTGKMSTDSDQAYVPNGRRGTGCDGESLNPSEQAQIGSCVSTYAQVLKALGGSRRPRRADVQRRADET